MKMIKPCGIILGTGAIIAAIAFCGGNESKSPAAIKSVPIGEARKPFEGDLKPNEPVIIPVKSREPPKPVEPEPSHEIPELPEPEDLALSDKIHTALQDDPAFSKIADIDNVSCDGPKCQIMAESKSEDNSLIMMGVITFLQNHPEYGQKFSKEDVKDNPKAALVTISRE